ncbi:MAG: hypothetical protein ACTSWA_10100, partial [Candidatus Thorarchaeota archaeon]
MREHPAEADIVRDTSVELRREELHKRLVIIDEEIKRVFEAERSEPDILYETAWHLLQAGGKRIRSLLTILSCEAVGGTIE